MRQTPPFHTPPLPPVQIKISKQEATESDHWRDFQTIREPIPYKS